VGGGEVGVSVEVGSGVSVGVDVFVGVFVIVGGRGVNVAVDGMGVSVGTAVGWTAAIVGELSICGRLASGVQPAARTVKAKKAVRI
jgi:hypothetical protein